MFRGINSFDFEMGITLPKTNIDTKNCHFYRELPFPNHYFGALHVSFRGVLLKSWLSGKWILPRVAKISLTSSISTEAMMIGKIGTYW